MFKNVISHLSENPKHIKEVKFINKDLKTVLEFIKEFDEKFTTDSPSSGSDDKEKSPSNS